MSLNESIEIKTIKKVVDIVFIIDAAMTGNYKIIFTPKLNNFLDEFFSGLKATKTIDSLRISIAWFNDTDKTKHYYKELPFTSIPDGKKEIASYFFNLSNVDINGGRTAMETVYAATNFDWIKDGDKIRHIIVLLTDHSDPFSELDYKRFFNAWHDNTCPLGTDWRGSLGNMHSKGKRMIIISPIVYPYGEMELDFEYLVRMDYPLLSDLDDTLEDRIKEFVRLIGGAISC